MDSAAAAGTHRRAGRALPPGSRRATAWRELGGVAGLVLHPTADFVDADGSAPFGLNNGSVAFSLQHGAVRVLFTGDVEQETDLAILAWGSRLQAQLLKVAHHGSRTSSQPLFVAAVAPAVAVMSLGEGNKFKHPAPEVVARYVGHGVRVLRTDHTGAVQVRIDGAGMVVQDDAGVRDAPSLAVPNSGSLNQGPQAVEETGRRGRFPSSRLSTVKLKAINARGTTRPSRTAGRSAMRPQSQCARVGRTEDGSKGVNAVHAEIGDGKGAALHGLPAPKRAAAPEALGSAPRPRVRPSSWYARRG